MKKSTVAGVLVLLFGILFLMKSLHFIDWEIWDVIISWQSLLIVIGLLLLFDKNRNNKGVGGVFVVVGTIFMLPRIFAAIDGSIVIPLLIIAGGVYWIVASVRRKNRKQSYFNQDHHHDFENKPFVEMTATESGYVKREYSFTGSKERWTYGQLKRVEIEAAFSGVELDFSQAELSDEVEQVHIKATAVFSGVTLYIPSDWNVMINKTGIFGGWVDKRPMRPETSSGKLVVLDLEAVFGGGEIKSYE